MKTVSSIFNAAMVPFSAAKARSIKSQPAIVNGAVQEALSQITFVESRSVIPLVPALFYGTNLYSIPQDEVRELIGVYPMKGQRSGNVLGGTDDPGNNFPGTYYPGQSANINAEIKDIRMEYREGMEYLLINQDISNGGTVILSKCDAVDRVTPELDAANVSLNTIFARENSSIDFDLNIVEQNGRIVFNIDSLDISSITRDGTIQASVFIPEKLVGNLTEINLQLSNDDTFTNAANMTATGNAFGNNFMYGWQPVRFDYRSKAEAGSFNESAITYFSLDFVHTGTEVVTGVKVDSVKGYKGLGYELHYYNQKHFKNAAGLFLTEATKTDDVVIANDRTVQIIIQECRKLIDFELRGDDGGQQYNLAERKLFGVFPNPGLYEKYRMELPSEKLPVITDY